MNLLKFSIKFRGWPGFFIFRHMKYPFIIALLFSVKGYSQNADAILGKWLKANKEDLVIQVFKVGQEYKGKITWSKDKKKPVGFVMLEKLKYNKEEKEWEGGKIHDPNSDRSYNATVKMNPDGTIEVIGGMLFVKVKRVFKRVT
jgi:uncharacterized protein (DUF2147 family)